MKLLGLLLGSIVCAVAEPRIVVLSGTVTNTTVELTAPAIIELTIDGEKATARFATSPPLTGKGALTGRYLGGWCELRGDLDGGFSVQFRGVLNSRAFRGTYTATPVQGPMQYGRFEFLGIDSAAK